MTAPPAQRGRSTVSDIRLPWESIQTIHKKCDVQMDGNHNFVMRR